MTDPPRHLADVARAELGEARLPKTQERPGVAPAIAILKGDAIAGWMVGFVADERLLGYVQFDTRGVLVRTSWFPARTAADCPRADGWLDIDTIRATAARDADSRETLGTPTLSFDRDPSRLLWRVPVVRDGRSAGTIAVVGASAFRERRGDDDATG